MSDLTPAELAGVYDRLADDVDADEATSYTADDVFAATERLTEALTKKLHAASHIRTARPRRRLRLR